MGDSEPASGLCGIVKTVLAMERQEIPPTLHYNAPNPKIPALKDGRVLVVNKSLPWSGKYAAVNAVGIGGHNAHALLKANEKPKRPQPEDSIPRLVIGSARTESAINYMLDRVSILCRYIIIQGSGLVAIAIHSRVQIIRNKKNYFSHSLGVLAF